MSREPRSPRARAKEDGVAASNLSKLGVVAARLAGFRPAHNVLVPVRTIKTVFPWVNLVSQVGGWPSARFTLLHGESGDGKTKFAMGLGLSFLMEGGFFAHRDVEQTTPIDWPRVLFGAWADSPGFVASREASFERTRSEIRHFCDTVAEARRKGEIPPETPALILIDSIRKLVPDNIWSELTKGARVKLVKPSELGNPEDEDEGEGKVSRGRGGRRGRPRGVDGYGGRAAQLKAALNAAWLDELIPLLAATDVAMSVITRETLDDDGEVKTGGGKALFYDSSLVVRVERDGYITNGQKPNEGEVIFGERHAVVVRKTKIAGREERWPTAYFHSANDKLPGVPAGFDRPRDLLELGLHTGAVESKGGGWIAFHGENIGQGVNKAVQALHARPELAKRLEAAVLGQPPPVELDTAVLRTSVQAPPPA